MKQVVNAQNAPAAIGPYSHCVKVGKMVFTSGQIGIDPAVGGLVEGVEAQTIQALTNLKGVREAGGSSMENIVKTTVFVKDMNDFGLVNGIYAQYFTDPYPARSCVEVARLPKDVLVECEVIAEL